VEDRTADRFLKSRPEKRLEMKTVTLSYFVVLFIFCIQSPVRAGVTLNISDDTPVDPGLQVQRIVVSTGESLLSACPEKKQPLSFGLSYDGRNRLTENAAKGDIDCQWLVVAALAEYPSITGIIFREAGRPALDPDDATPLIALLQDAPKNPGDGWYIQAGYFISDWDLEPWASYQRWEKNIPDAGESCNTWQLGLSYFIKGHTANIKIGYERFKTDADSAEAADKDAIDTILTEFCISY